MVEVVDQIKQGDGGWVNGRQRTQIVSMQVMVVVLVSSGGCEGVVVAARFEVRWTANQASSESLWFP